MFASCNAMSMKMLLSGLDHKVLGQMKQPESLLLYQPDVPH